MTTQQLLNAHPMPQRETSSPAATHARARIDYWDSVAGGRATRTWDLGRSYHRRLERVYSSLVAPGGRVLELGCGRGDLLAALKSSVGVGVDFSAEMLAQARQRHPELRFIQADAAALPLSETFDVIILSDLVNDLWDVQRTLEEIRPLCAAGTRVIVNAYSHLWEWPLGVAKRLRLARPTLRQNWLTVEDLSNLMYLSGFEVIRHWEEVLCPLPIPLLSGLCNRYLVRFWPFRYGALTNFIIARPAPPASASDREPVVSVVVPARNEEGNIAAIFQRTPEMGAGTELIFVEGHSKDQTYAAIERAIAENPNRRAKLLRQTGKGKGDAVRAGFAAATGDVLMILDADLTVPPEDLPRFYEVLRSGKAEFVNGVRLIYPMEDQAMRMLNLIGNKFFGLAFSWMLGQSIKDTLCGTKVLSKQDYELIAANRAYFGDFDPFGDFDLLFGAAKLNRKIVDLPVRYRQRTYGTTNISRFSHGWLLLRMVAFAAGRIKFI